MTEQSNKKVMNNKQTDQSYTCQKGRLTTNKLMTDQSTNKLIKKGRLTTNKLMTDQSYTCQKGRLTTNKLMTDQSYTCQKGRLTTNKLMTDQSYTCQKGRLTTNKLMTDQSYTCQKGRLTTNKLTNHTPDKKQQARIQFGLPMSQQFPGSQRISITPHGIAKSSGNPNLSVVTKNMSVPTVTIVTKPQASTVVQRPAFRISAGIY
ncbi:unnamed protein product [Mytilus coruscus]|uniref:Uncharacterized protein n=1 Tax=Mytilus coruscus TaxID=42192 RepID=A0A6J8E4L0_MYTCO|nr:unnamed protein product [Mytilus coruscus]